MAHRTRSGKILSVHSDLEDYDDRNDDRNDSSDDEYSEPGGNEVSEESDNDIYEPRLTCLKNLLKDPTNIHIVNREIKAYACGCTGCGGYIDLDDHLVWKVEKVGFYMCCCFRKYH
jgi:hypothetical protein